MSFFTNRMETQKNLEEQLEKQEENNVDTTTNEVEKNTIENLNKNKLSIPLAIIIVGIFISGSIYFSSLSKEAPNDNGLAISTLAPITKEDRILGNPGAKISIIIYGDFQCPFCAAVTGLGFDSPAMQPVVNYLKEKDPTWTPYISEIIKNYVKNGDVLLVYRDFTFLGKESTRSAEAARCAGDQNKFWEYHDYLYSHQGIENDEGFSDANLKSFAKDLELEFNIFEKCFNENKYTQAVLESKEEGVKAGVTGTPKGFILKNNKIVNTIDGAESFSTVKQKIDAILK